MDCRTQLASLAIVNLEQGDFLMATRILTTSIRMEPNNHELYFERSICHYKLGDYRASIDDANAAIRLNPTDYSIHYQKGLALLGLNMLQEAVISFKKAIELRAKQEDSKLSDIFGLLKHAVQEYNKRREARNESVPTRQPGANTTAEPGTSSDPVDSTTDRSSIRASGSSSTHNNAESTVNNLIRDGSNSLVATNRNIKTNNLSQVQNGATLVSRVSSSAHQLNNRSMINISGGNVEERNLPANIMDKIGNQNDDQSKASQFEWNIRRSERIFLHQPGPSGSQYGILPRPNDMPVIMIGQQAQKNGSNSSSIGPVQGLAPKVLYDNGEPYQNNTTPKSKESIKSLESEVDVDDSYKTEYAPATSLDCPSNCRKRVMIAPSSSMPAASQEPINPNTSRDDSYSSKYKRLRRDRERARRGTSKLCTIKLSDLEELQKSPQDCSKRFMRVIAPIDGWLYSGQLSLDDTSNNSDSPQYIVRLDGDSSGSSYLFSQTTVLNDVIKEVRVKSVSELRKGARICCYWSRQYKCLSTGVVTSRTFEETKSLVSVKYDNGDLSALPLEDLRLLPPDYPKYMSNCDPLLLARNGDGTQIPANQDKSTSQSAGSRIIVKSQQPLISVRCENASANSVSRDNDAILAHPLSAISPEKSAQVNVLDTIMVEDAPDEQEAQREEFTVDEEERSNLETVDEDDDEDATIPPTDETIDFITSESTLKEQDDNHVAEDGCVERVTSNKETLILTQEIPSNANNSRASSEENNYGIEYRPWMFEGPPKRSKRHGRTYRENYSSIRRGNEVIKVGDSAELMPRDESILPFIAKIDGLWSTGRGEMRVRVRWYYRLVETEGEPYDLQDGENALFETDHFDENDVQSIYRSTKILSWTEYSRDHLRHVNDSEGTPKIFYLAGYYDPVRRTKHLRSDVKENQ